MGRMTLPNRRECTRQSVRIGGERVYLDVGFTTDGAVCEIWLTLSQTGAQERALFDEIARAASKRLQLGESLPSIAEGWIDTQLTPRGAVVGDARIKFCNGPLDYAGRHLLIQYCGREELAHVKRKDTVKETI